MVQTTEDRLGKVGGRLPIRIVVRSNTPWESMNRQSFAAQADPKLPLMWIRRAVHDGVMDAWDRVFSIDFFTYRARIRDIAVHGMHQVPNSVLTTGLESVEDWLAQPGEEIVVPTDDDDLVSTRLPDVVDAFEDDVDVVMWPFARVGFLEQHQWRTCQLLVVPVLASNNWAIRKSFLAANFPPDQIARLLANHWHANRAFARVLGVPAWAPHFIGGPMLIHPRARFLGDVGYTIYNAHPGCISYLTELFSAGGDTALSSLNLDTPAFVPEYLSDLAPRVREVEELVSAVRRKLP